MIWTNFKHLIWKPTCYEWKTTSVVDRIITNHKIDFMKPDVCEAGLSDHHEIIFQSWEKRLSREDSKQFFVGVLETLIKATLMINW